MNTFLLDTLVGAITVAALVVLGGYILPRVFWAIQGTDYLSTEELS